MRHPILSTRQAVLDLAIVLAVGSVGLAQLSWPDIAHPDDPHAMSYDALISIPPLLSDPNEVIMLPVLVILIEFPDAIHQRLFTHRTSTRTSRSATEPARFDQPPQSSADHLGKQ